MASNDERLLADFLRAVNSVLSSDDVNELLLELDVIAASASSSGPRSDDAQLHSA